MTNNHAGTKKDSRKLHNIHLPDRLHRKLSAHIDILKSLDDRSITNQTWITKAIKNKINKTGIQNPLEIPKQRTVCVKIDQRLLSEIDEKVEFLKKFNRTYSKSKLIVEAILEQLDEEQNKIKELIKNS